MHESVSRPGTLAGGTYRTVASASFSPEGPGYDAAFRLRQRTVALRGGDDAVLVAFSWVRGAVRVRVLAHGECSSEDVDRAICAGRRLAAVDDDPSDFFDMVRGHPVLGRLARRFDPRIASTPTVFESFAVAIIEQLVTTAEARASIRRLWRLAGAKVPGTELVAPPVPAAVRRVPMWKMRAIGIGSRRAATLREVSGRGEAIERARQLAPEDFVAKVQSIPGVGPWTANAVARSGLGWADAVPVGDFHAPFVIAAALGGLEMGRDDPKAADEAMLALLAPFRPHRARVALLFERAATRARASPLPRIDPHRREPWRY